MPLVRAIAPWTARGDFTNDATDMTNILPTKENANPEVPKIKSSLTAERCNRLCGNCVLHGSFASMKILLLRILCATFRKVESGFADYFSAQSPYYAFF